MSESLNINVTVNPKAVTLGCTNELNRLLNTAFAGFEGVTQLPVGAIIRHVGTGVSVGELRPVDQATRETAGQWILGHAACQAVEALSEACDDFRRICAIARASRGGPVAVSQFDPSMSLKSLATLCAGEKEADKNIKRGLSDKLQSMKDDFGLQLPPLESELATVQQLRNCLTHRFGD